MGVIIKYQLVFSEGLKVSNDLYSGEFLVDADITARMMRGAMGGDFDLKLYDLPQAKADSLFQVLKQQGKLEVSIKLGYVDDPFALVMDGKVKEVRTSVQDDKLVTSISGEESGTYALRKTLFAKFKQVLQGSTPIKDVVKKLMATAEAGVDQTPNLDEAHIKDNLPDKRFNHENLLQALDGLAKSVGAEFLVCDKKVWIGKPIRVAGASTLKLDRDTNLAIFQPFSQEVPEEKGLNLLKPIEASLAQGFSFTIAGDPNLRPGHRVMAALQGYDAASGTEFRVHSLAHKFNMTGGYTCEGVVLKTPTSEQCRRQQEAVCPANAQAIASQLAKKIRAVQESRPLIEIGKVKAYKPVEHKTSLYYRQRFERTETQPSLKTEVDTDEAQVLLNKPLAAPFAAHRCGLVVPVYPGMKALLNHNLSLDDDAVVAGFIWSEKPVMEPPKNKAGDWWLCLPVDFDTSKHPEDSTTAVNDLIANNGKRVIEVKGLKLTIGQRKLPKIGERPQEGQDDEFLIEHKSGTSFTIAADGTLTIEAKKIALKGDVSIEGNVAVK